MATPHWKFLLAATVTAFCGDFQMYHASVINVPEKLFIEFINQTNIERTGSPMSTEAIAVLWGWVVSVFGVGGLVGALAAPFFAEKFGRKFSFMVLSNLIAILSSLLMSFSQMAHSYEMLTVGRFFIGFSVGISTAILPIYLSECSPMKHRGMMGSMQNFSLNFTTILAFTVALPKAWGDPSSLPLLLGLGILPALLQIFTSFFLLESPKYLYIKRKNLAAAEKSVRFWFASSDSSVDVDVKKIFHQYEQEAKALDAEVGFFRAMKVPCFRSALIVSTVILTCQAFTGTGVIFSYSTDMFLKLGFTTDLANICTIVMAVVTTLGSLIVSPCVEKYPRRKSYFSSYVVLLGTLIVYTIFSVVFNKKDLIWAAYISLSSIFLYSIVYNMGAGALTLIIPSEISPQAIRSTVSSVANGVGWLISLLTMFIYPPVENKIGSWSFFIFIVPLSVGLIYLYKVMPESGQRTISQIINQYSSNETITSDKPILGENETRKKSNAVGQVFWVGAQGKVGDVAVLENGLHSVDSYIDSY